MHSGGILVHSGGSGLVRSGSVLVVLVVSGVLCCILVGPGKFSSCSNGGLVRSGHVLVRSDAVLGRSGGLLVYSGWFLCVLVCSGVFW